MKPRCRSRYPQRPFAFTVIELLVVMSVIIVLAGLILSISGYVQKKGARSRAEAEIAAMSAALESYKADNGIYPTDSTTTENFDPTTTTSLSYSTASVFLYNSLAGAANGSRSPTAKSYFTFKPNMLAPKDQTQVVSAIVDPFGNSYGYSTAKASGKAFGNNPTFDLWSVADGATGTDQTKWIKNW